MRRFVVVVARLVTRERFFLTHLDFSERNLIGRDPFRLDQNQQDCQVTGGFSTLDSLTRGEILIRLVVGQIGQNRRFSSLL